MLSSQSWTLRLVLQQGRRVAASGSARRWASAGDRILPRGRSGLPSTSWHVPGPMKGDTPSSRIGSASLPRGRIDLCGGASPPYRTWRGGRPWSRYRLREALAVTSCVRAWCFRGASLPKAVSHPKLRFRFVPASGPRPVPTGCCTPASSRHRLSRARAEIRSLRWDRLGDCLRA